MLAESQDADESGAALRPATTSRSLTLPDRRDEAGRNEKRFVISATPRGIGCLGLAIQTPDHQGQNRGDSNGRNIQPGHHDRGLAWQPPDVLQMTFPTHLPHTFRTCATLPMASLCRNDRIFAFIA